MQSQEKLAQLVINEEGFMFDPTTGDSYVVNRTAMTVLGQLQDGRNENEIAADLAEQFEVSADEALRDVTDFVARLRGLQLV